MMKPLLWFAAPLILSVSMRLSAETSPTPATAPASNAVAEEAIRRADAVETEGWAFKVTTTSEGKRTIETFDPSAPKADRWKLLLKDGKPPTPKETEKHAEERGRGDAKKQKLADMVDLPTLELAKEEPESLTYHFRMKATDAESKAMADKIRGTLSIRRAGPAVESLEIANTAKIGKAGLFSLSEFMTRIRYQPAPGRDEWLVESVTARIRGRAMLVKSLDADSEAVFSDFRWVGKGDPVRP